MEHLIFPEDVGSWQLLRTVQQGGAGGEKSFCQTGMAEDLWGWPPRPPSVPQAGFSSGEQTPSLDDHEGPGRPLGQKPSPLAY